MLAIKSYTNAAAETYLYLRIKKVSPRSLSIKKHLHESVIRKIPWYMILGVNKHV